MIKDLKNSPRDARAKGEYIIIGGNLNLETTRTPWKEIAEEFELKDAIRETHGDKGPSTWRMGKKQINAILVTRSLQITACGYLPIARSVGDHRTIWINIPHKHSWGTGHLYSQPKQQGN